jgi:nucleotide-binding universal stress UspA family protein
VSSSEISFKRILVAFDGSANASRACEVAATLAGSYGSELTVLYAMPSLSVLAAPIDQSYALQLEQANKRVDEAVALIEAEGVKPEREVLQARASILHTIIEFAESAESDLVVMGTRGLGGFRKMMIGSVSAGMLAHAHCPVLVVRMAGSERPRFKRILVAVDGSKHSQKAVRAAVSLAKTLGAQLTAINAMAVPWMAYSSTGPLPLDDLTAGLREVAEKVTGDAAAIGKSEGVDVKRVIKDGIHSPVRSITEYAKEENVDLIVVGTRGLGGFRRLLLGSVASGVTNYATCSVLVVR